MKTKKKKKTHFLFFFSPSLSPTLSPKCPTGAPGTGSAASPLLPPQPRQQLLLQLALLLLMLLPLPPPPLLLFVSTPKWLARLKSLPPLPQ